MRSDQVLGSLPLKFNWAQDVEPLHCTIIIKIGKGE